MIRLNKKISKIKLAVILVAAISLGLWWRASATAQPTSEPNRENIEKVDSAKIGFSNKEMTFNQNVNGDVICVSMKRCVIRGVVHGDILVAALDIEIDAEVYGSVRAIGNNVTLTERAKISRNLSVLAQTEITIKKGAKIDQDAFLINSISTRVEGKIGRDLKMIGKDNYVVGQVGRNVDIVSSRYTGVNSTAKVNGNLMDRSVDSYIERSAVSGNITSLKFDTKANKYSSSFHLIMLIGLLGMSALILLFRPKTLLTFSQQEFKLTNVFLVAVGIGMIVIMPVLAAVFLVTVIGVPFSVLLFGAWLVLIILSVPVGVYYIANNTATVLGKQNNELLIMSVGILGYLALGSLPVLNIVVHIVVIGLGAGVVVKMFFGNLKNNKQGRN